MMHVVELDAVRKYRNASEWRTQQRARCGDFEEIGDGQIIVKLAAKMLEAGLRGELIVMRGKTPVFTTGTVEEWARGWPGRGDQPWQLRRAKP